MSTRIHRSRRVTSTALHVQRRCLQRSATSGSARDAGVRATSHRFEEEAERMAAVVTGVRASSSPESSSAVPPNALRASPVGDGHGNGQPLSPALRSSLEPRFGYDFSGVRVHADGQAAERARALEADAYAVGPHIGFAAGRFAPYSAEGGRLLAHELTHVIQQGHAASLSADASPVSQSPVTVMPYRSKKSPNFRTCDGGGLTEEQFTDKDKDPWIQEITVDFNATTNDSDGDLVPTGTLTAKYFANAAKRSDVSASIVGGKASEGLSDHGNHTVTRIEGCGYHHTSVPKADRLTGHARGFKYFKPGKTDTATMSFAVFFKEGKASGNQAIHKGSLTSGSLACVHVDVDDTLRQINYHSRKGETKVALGYGAASLAKLCCARFAVKKYMVSNPCGGQDAKKCP